MWPKLIALTNLLLAFHHIEEKMTALSNFKKARLFHKKTRSRLTQSGFLYIYARYQIFTRSSGFLYIPSPSCTSNASWNCGIFDKIPITRYSLGE